MPTLDGQAAPVTAVRGGRAAWHGSAEAAP